MWMQHVSTQLNLNVLAYDYVGYGINEPHGVENCSESVCYASFIFAFAIALTCFSYFPLCDIRIATKISMRLMSGCAVRRKHLRSASYCKRVFIGLSVSLYCMCSR